MERRQDFVESKSSDVELGFSFAFESIRFSSDFFFLCCNGHVVRRVGGSFAKCCGVKTYDSRYFFCGKDNRIIALCGKLSYDPDKQICCGGKLSTKTADNYSKCCGLKNYDSRTHFCYHGYIHKKCDGGHYDPKTYICCADKIRPRVGGENTECCKDRSYDKYG